MTFHFPPQTSFRPCPTGKVGYLTKIGASEAITVIRRRHRRKQGEGEWRPYYCRACGNWHLTSEREK